MNQIAITVDCTQSMHSASYVVQREVRNFINFIFNEIPYLELAIVCHGDDPDPIYSSTYIDFTSDQQSLINFINKMPRYGPNGTEDEYYQQVQNFVQHDLTWKDNSKKAYVFIADSTPRTERKFLNWQTVAGNFKLNGINTYSVQCLDRSFAREFFKEFNRITEGNLITLNQFSDLPKLLQVLFVYTESKEDAEKLVQTFDISKTLAISLSGLFKKTINHTENNFSVKTSGTKDVGELIPVSLNRFQKLNVDEDCSIEEFVNKSGAEFKVGHGFYELTKVELIQEKKEVILVDIITNEMFTGGKVRQMINLPYGQRGKVYKYDIPLGYKMFVQSTSTNRKLEKNTEFLYEANL